MMPGHTSRQWRRCGIKVAVLGCRNTSCSINLHDCPGDGERERGREGERERGRDGEMERGRDGERERGREE